MKAAYERPYLIWLLCPIVLYLSLRIWVLARRKEMHEDPVVFILSELAQPGDGGRRGRSGGGCGAVTRGLLESFGRIHRGRFATVRAVPSSGPCLSFGAGKSYGDSCLPAANGMAVIPGSRTDIRFDPSTGVLEAHPLTPLSDIILHCGPLGLVPPGHARHKARHGRRCHCQ